MKEGVPRKMAAETERAQMAELVKIFRTSVWLSSVESPGRKREEDVKKNKKGQTLCSSSIGYLMR